MTTTLTVRDESPGGGTLHEVTLEFLDETISVRELIRARIYQEVQDHNLRQHVAGPYRGLVQPEGIERELNGARPGSRSRPVDWKAQFARATEAFDAGQILILIDDRQAESLDETFTIRPDSDVSFLRLSLLVGG